MGFFVLKLEGGLNGRANFPPLSIPFMGFFVLKQRRHSSLGQQRRSAFNSLYGIFCFETPLKKVEMSEIEFDFQFPLWDFLF